MVGQESRNHLSNPYTDNDAKPKLRRRRGQEPDDTEIATQKRRRVTRACDQCRQGREKCNGERPCQACQTADRQCTFKGESKKRGVQPGYIRALEALLAWTVTHINGADAQLRELLAREPVTDELGIASKDTTTSDNLANTWIQSQVHKDLDQLLTSKTASHEARHSLRSDDQSANANQAADDWTTQSYKDVDMLYRERTPLATIVESEIASMPPVLAQMYGLDMDHQADSSAIDSIAPFPTDFTGPIDPSLAGLLDLPDQPFDSKVLYGGFNFFSEQNLPYSQSSPNALDAFLDELASAEFSETSTQQPQFMQNLGLGPNASPSEMMNDAGEWFIP